MRWLMRVGVRTELEDEAEGERGGLEHVQRGGVRLPAVPKASTCSLREALALEIA